MSNSNSNNQGTNNNNQSAGNSNLRSSSSGNNTAEQSNSEFRSSRLIQRPNLIMNYISQRPSDQTTGSRISNTQSQPELVVPPRQQIQNPFTPSLNSLSSLTSTEQLQNAQVQNRNSNTYSYTSLSLWPPSTTANNFPRFTFPSSSSTSPWNATSINPFTNSFRNPIDSQSGNGSSRPSESGLIRGNNLNSSFTNNSSSSNTNTLPLSTNSNPFASSNQNPFNRSTATTGSSPFSVFRYPGPTSNASNQNQNTNTSSRSNNNATPVNPVPDRLNQDNQNAGRARARPSQLHTILEESDESQSQIQSSSSQQSSSSSEQINRWGQNNQRSSRILNDVDIHFENIGEIRRPQQNQVPATSATNNTTSNSNTTGRFQWSNSTDLFTGPGRVVDNIESNIFSQSSSQFRNALRNGNNNQNNASTSNQNAESSNSNLLSSNSNSNNNQVAESSNSNRDSRVIDTRLNRNQAQQSSRAQSQRRYLSDFMNIVPELEDEEDEDDDDSIFLNENNNLDEEDSDDSDYLLNQDSNNRENQRDSRAFGSGILMNANDSQLDEEEIWNEQEAIRARDEDLDDQLEGSSEEILFGAYSQARNQLENADREIRELRQRYHRIQQLDPHNWEDSSSSSSSSSESRSNLNQESQISSPHSTQSMRGIIMEPHISQIEIRNERRSSSTFSRQQSTNSRGLSVSGLRNTGAQGLSSSRTTDDLSAQRARPRIIGRSSGGLVGLRRTASRANLHAGIANQIRDRQRRTLTRNADLNTASDRFSRPYSRRGLILNNQRRNDRISQLNNDSQDEQDQLISPSSFLNWMGYPSNPRNITTSNQNNSTTVQNTSIPVYRPHWLAQNNHPELFSRSTRPTLENPETSRANNPMSDLLNFDAYFSSDSNNSSIPLRRQQTFRESASLLNTRRRPGFIWELNPMQRRYYNYIGSDVEEEEQINGESDIDLRDRLINLESDEDLTLSNNLVDENEDDDDQSYHDSVLSELDELYPQSNEEENKQSSDGSNNLDEEDNDDVEYDAYLRESNNQIYRAYFTQILNIVKKHFGKVGLIILQRILNRKEPFECTEVGLKECGEFMKQLIQQLRVGMLSQVKKLIFDKVTSCIQELKIIKLNLSRIEFVIQQQSQSQNPEEYFDPKKYEKHRKATSSTFRHSIKRVRWFMDILPSNQQLNKIINKRIEKIENEHKNEQEKVKNESENKKDKTIALGMNDILTKIIIDVKISILKLTQQDRYKEIVSELIPMAKRLLNTFEDKDIKAYNRLLQSSSIMKTLFPHSFQSKFLIEGTKTEEMLKKYNDIQNDLQSYISSFEYYYRNPKSQIQNKIQNNRKSISDQGKNTNNSQTKKRDKKRKNKQNCRNKKLKRQCKKGNLEFTNLVTIM
eukprot:403332626